MCRRLTAVLVWVLLSAGCQPQQPPITAAPPPTASSPGIALPAPEGTRRYDPAIKPVDETRAARAVTRPRAAPPRPVSERERQAIAAWEKEEAAASRTALTVTPPTRTRSKLSLPGDVSALPQPSGERTAPPPPTGELAVPPSAGDRPELPQAAEMPPSPPPAPARATAAAAPPPVPAAPEPRTEAVVPPPAPPPSPAAQAAPARTTAASTEPRRRPPAGPPLTTVIFTPRSANLSDDARVALGFFAQDPRTQRLRRIELWAGSSADDPADAGKIAFARALAVHAYLIDLGVKAQIEIAGYAETGGVSPDRVDVTEAR
jgi:hypothetical protein